MTKTPKWMGDDAKYGIKLGREWFVLCRGVDGFVLYDRTEWQHGTPADLEADAEGYLQYPAWGRLTAAQMRRAKP